MFLFEIDINLWYPRSYQGADSDISRFPDLLLGSLCGFLFYEDSSRKYGKNTDIFSLEFFYISSRETHSSAGECVFAFEKDFLEQNYGMIIQSK